MRLSSEALANNLLIAPGPCVLTVNLAHGIREKCTWLDLWRGAIAVDKMCVQNGKTGVSFEHGKLRSPYAIVRESSTAVS